MKEIRDITSDQWAVTYDLGVEYPVQIETTKTTIDPDATKQQKINVAPPRQQIQPTNVGSGASAGTGVSASTGASTSTSTGASTGTSASTSTGASASTSESTGKGTGTSAGKSISVGVFFGNLCKLIILALIIYIGIITIGGILISSKAVDSDNIALMLIMTLTALAVKNLFE